MEQLNMGQFGVMNALRTGNIALDMAAAMTIPLLFKLCMDTWEKLKPQVLELIEKYCTYKPEIYLRRIEYVKRSNSWGYEISDSEQRNNILQKAIAMHLGYRDDLHYKRASFSLMSLPDSDKNKENETSRSTAEILKKYNVSTLPPEEEWVTVTPNVEFMQTVNEKEEGKDNNGRKETKIVYSIRSQHPKGEEYVNAWVRKVFNEYIARVEAQADTKRYMYAMLQDTRKSGGEEGGEDGAPKRLYKRYQLSEHKSFKSLFMPEKDSLLRLIHHFEKKEGKFAIEGYPHKLGLLLHGPPGTGKTSLIKALAQHTGRHIVSVPLARIQTNQELMDVMFDQSFAVTGQDLPFKLSFGQVIFVLEDVDAASSVVQRRDKKEKKGKGTTVKTTTVKLTRGGAAAAAADGTAGDVRTPRAGGGAATTTTTAAATAESEKTDATGTTGAPPPPPSMQLVRQESTTVEEEEEEEQGQDDTPDDQDVDALVAAMLTAGDTPRVGSGPATTKKGSPSYHGCSDKLDLAGLLNVLDGVVDAPNRILIMTSNHPEKLDPALIRPGRINRKIYLGYIQYEEAAQMVQHYFGSDALTDEVRERMRVVFANPTLKLTPAQVEQQCAEHDFVEDFLVGLQGITTKY